MYDLSPESFKSLQAAIQKLCVWPMTDELQEKRQRDSLALGKPHCFGQPAGVELAPPWGGVEGRRGGRENKIIFIPQYGTARSNPEPPGRGVHRAQLNSGRSLRRRQFVLAVPRLSWLSQGEPGSWPRAGGSHLRKLSHARVAHWTGRQIYRDARHRQIHWLMTAREGDKMREKKTQKEGKSCHPLVLLIAAIKVFCFGFFFVLFCVFAPWGILHRSCWNAAELIW